MNFKKLLLSLIASLSIGFQAQAMAGLAAEFTADGSTADQMYEGLAFVGTQIKNALAALGYASTSLAKTCIGNVTTQSTKIVGPVPNLAAEQVATFNQLVKDAVGASTTVVAETAQQVTQEVVTETTKAAQTVTTEVTAKVLTQAVENATTKAVDKALQTVANAAASAPTTMFGKLSQYGSSALEKASEYTCDATAKLGKIITDNPGYSTCAAAVILFALYERHKTTSLRTQKLADKIEDLAREIDDATRNRRPVTVNTHTLRQEVDTIQGTDWKVCLPLTPIAIAKALWDRLPSFEPAV